MNVLIVKMSSLGDVVHGLTLATEILKRYPDANIDWVVEEAFADVPRRHPGVRQVIPVAIRRWRQNWITAFRQGEPQAFVSQLRRRSYDLVIDSQGLIKSAIVSLLAKGTIGGFDRASAREPMAALIVKQAVKVSTSLHAVERQRQLAAGLFHLTLDGQPDYGLSKPVVASNRIMLVHGTTWPSKHWPESNWEALAKLGAEDNHEVVLPAGNQQEQERAERIAKVSGATVLPRGSIEQLMDDLGRCGGVVAVDTGIAHIATAFNVPLVTMYGPTDPALTGTHGPRQINLASDHLPCIPCGKRTCRYQHSTESSKIFPPCFEPLTPEMVWQALQQQINNP